MSEETGNAPASDSVTDGSAASFAPGTREARALAAAARLLTIQLLRPPAPGLHLVATPIGNLGDITLRAIAVMALADCLYCEDTRHTRKLLEQCGIDRQLQVYEDHGAERERPRILAALASGASVALVSDAGMPLVSDPGYKLVREALAAGHDVSVVPGASSALAALVVSGLPTDRFMFEGFLPSRQLARRQRLEALRAADLPVILFEAPNRLAALLADGREILGDHRTAAVARELTKRFEEVRRGSLAELAEWASATPPRGEVCVVLGPAVPGEVTDAMIRERLAAMPADLSQRDAVRLVAADLGVSRGRVYDLSLGKEAPPAPGAAPVAGPPPIADLPPSGPRPSRMRGRSKDR
ncbi:MAG: 16S rRNA (cytidine(1402)-2'-O)-methyltransferase [Rhizobiales bacterium]|nr:16S rRNA (cytidine(1402)-2'-O)-methyltransferase [Hyphomicrobiales bacterium]